MMSEAARRDFDVAVIGGGLVGSALALGLARAGQRVALLDEGDAAVRQPDRPLRHVQTRGDDLLHPPHLPPSIGVSAARRRALSYDSR